MSSTPGILDNSDATAITIGSDESVTLTSTVTTTGLIVNTDADSSFSIADGGTNAIVIKAAAGDELYIGANDTYAIRVLNDGTNNVVMDNGGGFHVGELLIHSNRISSGYTTDADDRDLWINYQGYNGGATRFRDFRVGDGKQAQIMFVDGSTKDTLFSGDVTVAKTGADSELTISGNTNYDPVLTLKSDQGAITTEGFQVWYDNSVGDVHLGTTYEHDNAAIRFHTRTGADKVATGVNERLTIHGNGMIQMPYQTCFSANPPSHTLQAINGHNKLNMMTTERFDIGSNYASSQFTAPVTGKYQFNWTVRVDGLAHTSAHCSVDLWTSNKHYVYSTIYDMRALDATPAYWNFTGAILADMDAGDVAYLISYFNGTTGNVITNSSWSGYLVA